MIRIIGRVGAAVVLGVAALTAIATPASAAGTDAAAAAAAAACSYQNVNLATRTATYVPPHTRGDRDFAGHGPNVNIRSELRVGAETTPTGSRGTLTVRLYMKAEETRSDWTTAVGTEDLVVYRAPTGWFVVFPLPFEDFDANSYRDTDHLSDVLGRGNPDSFISRYVVIGDTDGNEAGTRTRVTAETRPMTLRLSTCING